MKYFSFIILTAFAFFILFQSCEREDEICKGEGIADMLWFIPVKNTNDTLLSITGIGNSYLLIADTSSKMTSLMSIPLETNSSSCQYVLTFFSGIKDTVTLVYQQCSESNNLECGIQVNFYIDSKKSFSTTNRVSRFEIANTNVTFDYTEHVKIQY